MVCNVESFRSGVPSGGAITVSWLTDWFFPEREFLRSQALLREVIRRIVAVAEPEQVILFGSVARRQQRRNSDLDLLVIKSGVTDPAQLARQIRTNFFGIRKSIDIVVATPEAVQESRTQRWTFLGRIAQDGKVIYRNGVHKKAARQ